MTFKIQEASASDWVAIADLTQIANQQYAAEADPSFWGPYERTTREMLLGEKNIVRLVARDDDGIVGSVIYCPPYEREIAGQIVRNPYPEMRLLSVSPQHRGKGLATKLIEVCEQRANKEKVNAITLHTTRLMEIAKAMYEKRGYTRFPQIDFEPSSGFVVWGYIKQLQGEPGPSHKDHE
ncbi:MAG: GNAT family N-acetyltransferase [Cyanobacteria bacterium]|nr:GNAT family N-acetyltransferase [Cyanobacteriota bacterium]